MKPLSEKTASTNVSHVDKHGNSSQTREDAQALGTENRREEVIERVKISIQAIVVIARVKIDAESMLLSYLDQMSKSCISHTMMLCRCHSCPTRRSPSPPNLADKTLPYAI